MRLAITLAIMLAGGYAAAKDNDKKPKVPRWQCLTQCSEKQAECIDDCPDAGSSGASKDAHDVCVEDCKAAGTACAAGCY
jgi:hypothetical protein